jgi:hypothetical protein
LGSKDLNEAANNVRRAVDAGGRGRFNEAMRILRGRDTGLDESPGVHTSSLPLARVTALECRGDPEPPRVFGRTGRTVG